MPVKISTVCLIHSINEKDNTDLIIREAIAIIWKETNEVLEIKLTGKFVLNNNNECKRLEILAASP